jgi:hypothetical protein
MSYETYLNILRAEDRRIVVFRMIGDWKKVHEAILRKQQAEAEYLAEAAQ